MFLTGKHAKIIKIISSVLFLRYDVMTMIIPNRNIVTRQVANSFYRAVIAHSEQGKSAVLDVFRCIHQIADVIHRNAGLMLFLTICIGILSAHSAFCGMN